jgi:hypothetical protein
LKGRGLQRAAPANDNPYSWLQVHRIGSSPRQSTPQGDGDGAFPWLPLQIANPA